MSPVETWCHNINYYVPDEEGATNNFSAERMTKIRELLLTVYRVRLKNYTRPIFQPLMQYSELFAHESYILIISFKI